MKNKYSGILYIAFLIMVAAASGSIRGYLLAIRHQKSLEAAASSGKKSEPVSPHTLSQIQQSLAKREYHISYDSLKQALQSPNRAQELRAYYQPGKLTVINRKDSVGHNFTLELVNEGVFADGVKQFETEVSGENDLTGNALEIHHKGFTEQYINDSSGIRQNFIVNQAPPGTKQLQVRLNATGMQVNELGPTELELTSENGSKLYYRDLKCWDANKKPLDARMAYADGQIQIDVAVTGAPFPVTIDPLIVNGNPANAATLLEKDQGLATFGFSVSTAGDINSDGYSDVVIGAPAFDNGENNEGVVFVYMGSASGLTSTPDKTLERNQAESRFGHSVSNAGDVNGDGFSDVVVGAPMFDNNETNEGAAFIYLGSGTGLSTTPTTPLEPNQSEANFGQQVALAGDVDNNGFSDIIVGAPLFDKGQSNEGAAFIYHGSQSGIANLPVMTLESNQADAQFGCSVKGAGDVDGDGFSDVIVGASTYDNGQSNEGAAFIYHGSASGIAAVAKSILESNQATAYFGFSVSTAGDVNGDGFSDVIVGAFLFDNGQNNEGATFVYHGSANGVATAIAKQLECNQSGAQYGASVSAAGDVNGDGFSDIIVGANYYDNGQSNEGAAFVYEGSSSGIGTTPSSIQESNQANAYLGSAVSSAGDVNGDGYSDITVGAHMYDKGQVDEGAAFIWLGGARVSNEPTKPIIISQLESSSYEGNAVAYAGDINGDGYSDIVVGAIRYHEDGDKGVGGAIVYYGSSEGINVGSFDLIKQEQWWPYPQFGCSVAGAGDVNGDGFDDIIIGAYAYSTGGNDAGAAFIYYGSAGGILVNSPSILLDASVNSEFGRSVSTASDINDDGYDDVLVSAPLYMKNQINFGAVYVYLGSINGIQSIPQVIEGTYANAQFGCSISNAGDTNGDGFADLLIGAKNFSDGETNEGAAFLYKGSAMGIIPNEFALIQENCANAMFGSSVSNAGDLNGDGLGDIVVGAPNYGLLSAGAAFIYYGSSSGINVYAPAIVESDFQGSLFGISVKSSGDINSDGYGDLVVGAQDYQFGAAFVFNGSPAGINSTTYWHVVSNQNTNYGELMGASVSGAGDVNADGYSDIIIGSAFYKWAGGALIFYGNSNMGIRNNLRLYNTDLNTPINHNQFAQNIFGAGLFAKSFLGRGKGKLIWETKSAAQGFSKGSNNSVTTSTQSTGSQNTFTNLGLEGIELKNLINKQGAGTKVRVRVKYHPALALTGQTYGPWRYLPAYLMGNSTSPVPENVQDNLSQTKNSNDIMDANKWSEQVSVYPNPASDYLTINAHNPDQVKTIKIMTITGFLVYQSKGFKSSIDLKSLSRGVYSVIVTNQDGVQTTRKIVVAK